MRRLPILLLPLCLLVWLAGTTEARPISPFGPAVDDPGLREAMEETGALLLYRTLDLKGEQRDLFITNIRSLHAILARAESDAAGLRDSFRRELEEYNRALRSGAPAVPPEDLLRRHQTAARELGKKSRREAGPLVRELVDSLSPAQREALEKIRPERLPPPDGDEREEMVGFYLDHVRSLPEDRFERRMRFMKEGLAGTRRGTRGHLPGPDGPEGDRPAPKLSPEQAERLAGMLQAIRAMPEDQYEHRRDELIGQFDPAIARAMEERRRDGFHHRRGMNPRGFFLMVFGGNTFLHLLEKGL